MNLNMRMLVAVTVFTMIFPISAATDAFTQGFGPWGDSSGQPAFQAFGGSGTDMTPWSMENPPLMGTGPWSASSGWSAGRSLYQNYLLSNPDGSLSDPTGLDSEDDGGPSIFSDYIVGGPNTLWGFAPIGGSAGASQGELIVPPLW